MFDIDKVFEIVCGINAISNYAYDIHYSAKGKFFYSDHLFAERIGDTEEMEDEKDDLIETIYLGRGIEAPLSSDIAERVAELTPAVTDDTQLNFKMLRDMIVKVLIDIETLDDLTRGEEDLLGTIAHVLQRHNGLLFRQLSYTLEELQNSDDNFDWITVNGNHIPIPKGASEEEKSQAIKQFFKEKGGKSRSGKDAVRAFEKAKKSEPKITKEVTELAKKFGVENIGLKYRLKTEKSTLRKAKEIREEKPKIKSDKQAVASMWDIVRYTQGGTVDNVVEKGLDTLRALQDKGYKIFDIKNYWMIKDNPYKGINVKVLSPDGQQFEMQFNTAHNIEVKEEMHKYYELAREEKNAKKKKEYYDKMMEISKGFEVVKGFEKFNTGNIVARKVDSKTFYNNMKNAKDGLSPQDKWRVDLHSEKEYNNSKLYSTKGGSCVAVEKDGNIISVCRNKKSNDRGSELLKAAVSNGGTKLDAFGKGLYQFYTKNGFEPVSWVAFDENYAPEGWNKKRDEAEPIVFYKYTGNKVSDSYEDFLKKVKGSDSYDDAFNARDESIRG